MRTISTASALVFKASAVGKQTVRSETEGERFGDMVRPREHKGYGSSAYAAVSDS